jgi:hypothetical protein
MNNTINKTEVTKSLIHLLKEERHPEVIKAKDIDSLDTPDKVALKSNKQAYVPDVTAIYENSKTLYEIELDNTMPVDKWRLFSLYARKNNGSFYLVVPDYLKDDIKREIKEKDINAGVMFFPTK